MLAGMGLGGVTGRLVDGGEGEGEVVIEIGFGFGIPLPPALPLRFATPPTDWHPHKPPQ